MSGNFYSSSFSSSFNPEQYKDIYHRKVLVEKVIKNHSPLEDEFGWLNNSKELIWFSNNMSGYNVSWGSYDYNDKLFIDVKPHLEVPENVRKAISKKPPELTKKFARAYSNRNSSFNKGFSNRSRQFSRKAF